jgi:hypothetical protein
MISSEAFRVLRGWKENKSALYAHWFVGKDEVMPLGVVLAFSAEPNELTLKQGDKRYSFNLSGAEFGPETREPSARMKDPQIDKTLSTDPLEISLADKSRLTLFEIPE